jgi:hypothetical protein
VQQPGSPQQRLAVDGEEQAVPGGAWPAAGPADPLEERGDGGGQLTWITRSRSPTSMPSSSVEVETMTQSRASANACSERCRSAADRDACDRKTVTPASLRAAPSFFDELPRVAKDQPLLALVQRGDDVGGVLDRADVVQFNLPSRLARCRSGPRPFGRNDGGWPGVAGCALQPAQQFLRVPDGRRQAKAGCSLS